MRSKIGRSMMLSLASTTLATLALSTPCHADDFTAGDLWDDTKPYFTAPLRCDTKDWLYFGGALAAFGVAHAYDGPMRRHFAVGERALLNDQDPNDLRDAIPAAAFIAGNWVIARLIDDPDGRVESYTMLEAAGFSLITAEGLKVAAGRERPDQTTEVNAWREGGDSFPSFHATAAFAVGTVFAESGGDDYRWIRRLLGYGMATATAYVRVRENAHWLSDTVGGAAVGIATADFTLNRRRARAHRWDFSVEPMAGGGTELSLRITLHQ
jgi:membrane-associated phospholipid phosphatase